MNLIFIGQFVSKIESLNDINYSQAANLYQIKFLKLVNPKIAISIIPIFVNKNDNFSFKDHAVTFINNPFLKNNLINKLVRLCKDTIQTLKIITSSSINDVWFYNITVSTVFIVYYLQLFTNKKVFVLVADYDFGKNIIGFFVRKAIKNCDGAITWNSSIKHTNSRVVPDILDSEVIKLNLSKSIKPVFLFSGSLGKTTGFELALTFFSTYKDYELIITGKPYHYSKEEFDELISKYITPNDNIKYYGLLPLDKYYAILDSVDIALSLRDPIDPQHDGNFPSKILEYLSLGKMVISTKKYSDIDEFIYFYADSDLLSIDAVIVKILKIKGKDLEIKRRYIYNNLLENHTEKLLVKSIKFVSNN